MSVLVVPAFNFTLSRCLELSQPDALNVVIRGLVSGTEKEAVSATIVTIIPKSNRIQGWGCDFVSWLIRLSRQFFLI